MGRSRGELSNAASRGSIRPLVLEKAGGSDPIPGGRWYGNSPGGAEVTQGSLRLTQGSPRPTLGSPRSQSIPRPGRGLQPNKALSKGFELSQANKGPSQAGKLPLRAIKALSGQHSRV